MKFWCILIVTFFIAGSLLACGAVSDTPAKVSNLSESSRESTEIGTTEEDVTVVKPSPPPIPTPPLSTAPVELIPGRVRNAYPSNSELGQVEYQRDADGWNVDLKVQPSSVPDRGEWAGYCWDLSAVDGTRHSELVLEFANVSEAAEVEVKLERENNKIQEAVLQYLKEGTIEIDLSTYPRVRSEIARVCIMALGRATAKKPTTVKFKLSKVFVK
ncbi:MAG: hypothetical protein JXR76_26275 [Deltaproteobacteria bacterium]|nr:hypothetical protein [Deltaproteobacteria bacterium]